MHPNLIVHLAKVVAPRDKLAQNLVDPHCVKDNWVNIGNRPDQDLQPLHLKLHCVFHDHYNPVCLCSDSPRDKTDLIVNNPFHFSAIGD